MYKFDFDILISLIILDNFITIACYPDWFVQGVKRLFVVALAGDSTALNRWRSAKKSSRNIDFYLEFQGRIFFIASYSSYSSQG